MKKKLKRLCLISTELRGFGSFGGFGVLTHDIAVGLAARGIKVYVAMPAKNGQQPVETLDGLTVLSYPTPLYVGLREALPYAGLYRMIDADIYHSQEASLGTTLAQVAMPGKKHIISLIDPRNFHDWGVESAHKKLKSYQLAKYYFKYQWETGRAVRKADANYCHTKHIIEKSKKMFRLAKNPGFLPSPTRIIGIKAPKAQKPTVCYLGRWDERKRPELFLELAARFPAVTFIAAGACMNDLARDKVLRLKCESLKNVEAPGWLGENDRAVILDRAWVLVNTSSREGLPVTYLEAGAHKCAILSHCDADDFASSFGFWAKRGDLDDFTEGLKFLLQEDRWRLLGEKACNYVLETHEYERVIDQHVHLYEQLLQA